MWYYTFTLWILLSQPYMNGAARGLTITSTPIKTDTECILILEKITAFYEFEGMKVKRGICRPIIKRMNNAKKKLSK